MSDFFDVPVGCVSKAQCIVSSISDLCFVLIEFFVFNTNLTFLYKIDIKGFKKWDLNSQQQPLLD